MLGLATSGAAERLSGQGANPLLQRSCGSAPTALARCEGPLVRDGLPAVAFALGHGGVEGEPRVRVLAMAVNVILNTALELDREWRTDTAPTRFEAPAASHARSLRDGRPVRMRSIGLLAGDGLPLLESGDQVRAARVAVGARGGTLDDLFTSESVPIRSACPETAFIETVLVRSRSFFEITRTGTASAMGRFAATQAGIAVTETPLLRPVEALDRQTAAWALAQASSRAVCRGGGGL